MTTAHPPELDVRLRVGECPPWCTNEPGHDAEQMTPGNGRTHRGPMFGVFLTEVYEYATFPPQFDPVSVTLERGLVPDEDLTPADLRVIAHQAKAAALWLEARS